MAKYHKIDGWRGYSIPANAVMGSSDTGTFADSPCPSGEVKEELNDFRKFLKEQGISSRRRASRSSNSFMVKQWVIVSKDDLPRASKLANEYLAKHEGDTQHIHDADN